MGFVYEETVYLIIDRSNREEIRKAIEEVIAKIVETQEAQVTRTPELRDRYVVVVQIPWLG
ncbi:MAG: hypothetical protein J7L51_02900 [Desulfurococcales archaeon]|nr:hypothetical protein [Desulfurococcales archaeon]